MMQKVRLINPELHLLKFFIREAVNQAGGWFTALDIVEQSELCFSDVRVGLQSLISLNIVLVSQIGNNPRKYALSGVLTAQIAPISSVMVAIRSQSRDYESLLAEMEEMDDYGF